jgi:RNA polymerase sigma-70 factor (ECF subfamily)
MNLTIRRSKTLEQLIEGCVNKDRKAQQLLYERFAPVMFTVCLRYVKETAEAEDVLVKAFMKVFQHIGRFEGKGSLEGWIRRIVVNEGLAYLRSNKTMYLEVDIVKADTAPSANTDHLAVEDLMAMVQQLSIGYRTVFNLYAIEGYSHAEIAEMLQISEGTSKSQLSRARQLLQKMVADSEKGMQNQVG